MLRPILGFFIKKNVKNYSSPNLESYLHIRMENNIGGWRGTLYSLQLKTIYICQDKYGKINLTFIPNNSKISTGNDLKHVANFLEGWADILATANSY